MQYCFCDFETTWLDRQKDEPLQIGLIFCDMDMKYLTSYTSYIRPEKTREDFREIVKHLTSISFDDVKDAPSVADVSQEIQDMFDQPTILIGHNVWFDKAFLSRFGDFVFEDEYDTFVFSQYLIPYAKQYSLSWLVAHTKAPALTREFHVAEHDYRDDAHDALHDCVLTARLWSVLLWRIRECEQRYACHNVPGRRHWQQTMTTQQDKTKTFSFPSLTRPVSASSDREAHGEPLVPGFFSVHKQRFEDVLCQVAEAQGDYILVFHQRNKASLARQLLESWWYQTGHLFPEQYRDMSQLDLLCKKTKLTQEEILFVYGRCVHAIQWLSVIDLKRPLHHTIYHLARKEPKQTHTRLCVGTHQGLYQRYAQDASFFTKKQIVFWDADRWYHTINQYRQGQIRLGDFSLWDKTLYRLHCLHDVSWYKAFLSLYHRWLIYSSLISLIIKKLPYRAKRDPTPYRELQDVYTTIKQSHDDLQNLLRSDERLLWSQYRESYDRVREGDMSTYTHIDNEYYLSYSLRPEVQYTDFSEFVSYLPHEHTTYLSFLQDNKPSLYETTQIDHPPVVYTTNVKKLLPHIKAWSTVFIFSGKKDISQKVFSFLYKNNKHQHILVAENITGGIKKNLTDVAHWPAIIIGGYNTLSNLFEMKISIDIFVGFSIVWSLQQHIVADFSFYWYYIYDQDLGNE